MNKKNIDILAPIKRRIMLVMMVVFFILTCLIFFYQQSSKKEYEDKLRISMMDKQEMLTQLMSKDASQLYVLFQSVETGNTYQTDNSIENKIITCKNNLFEARKEFSENLIAMHNGYLIKGLNKIDIRSSIGNSSEYLSDIDELWYDFDKAINVLIDSTKINAEVAEAVIYINDNNIELLSLYNTISKTILENSINTSRQRAYIFCGFIGLLCIIAFVVWFQLLKYIILPFNALYKGISGIGLREYVSNKKTPTKQELVPMVSEISEMFKKISNLITLIENMNNNSSFMETLNFINGTFSAYIPYTYIGIALVDNDKKILTASYGVSNGTIVGMAENLIGKSVNLKDTSLEKLINTGEARIINDLEEYTSNKPLTWYNKIILAAGIKASITLPLKVAGEPVGVIFFSSNKKGVYSDEHVKFLKTLVNSIAISFNQNIFINDLLYSSILALAKMAEARDEDTGDHLERMKIYSKAIAEFLLDKGMYIKEINMEFIDKIERFSPLHDIGKVGINDDILLKSGGLTVEEFEEMKRHTIYGTEVLRAAESNIAKRGKSLFGIGIEIAEGHHEKWDGSGYPYGKKGEEIPLSARIVAVADVFDALTSRRPYKVPFSFEESLQIIIDGRGTHFDPEIVDIFIANRDEIYNIYQKFNL